MDRKIHLKGFSFARQSRAWLTLAAGEADAVYGDSFVRDGAAVRRIGNNVSLVFDNMDFGAGGRAALEITGSTPLDLNPIQVRFSGAEGELSTQECPFQGSGAQRFELEIPAGASAVTFVFLPGCDFDFERFRFIREE